MSPPIRVLHLEDSPRDAALIRDLLENEGINCEIVRVDTRPDFENALERGGFDIILTDNSLPNYDGASALQTVNLRRPSLPVIVISGSLGEDAAVKCLQHGATDYLLKDRLERLAPAFQRALSEARERQGREVAEAELRANEERMRLALLATNDAIWDWDLRQNRIVCNTTFERMFGPIATGENPKVWWYEHTHPDDRDAIRAGLMAAIAAGQPFWAASYRLQRVDGSWAQVQNRACLAKDDQDAVLRLIGAVQDVSTQVQAEAERHRLEEQLRQAQKMEAIGTLAGGIAHDFNNILGIIFANVDLVRRDVPPQLPERPEIDESLGDIYAAAHRARELVRQILTFSRHTPGERKLIKTQPIVRECVKLLRTTIPAMVRIVERIDPGSPCIQADPTQLHQVVMNICTNAWHALPDAGGQIIVDVSTVTPGVEVLEANPDLDAGTYVRLTISDNGHGMSPETRARIFEPFFTTKPTGQGTGLGLAVVHGIIKSHGGAITVQSSRNVGTTFEIYFPAQVGEAPADEILIRDAPAGRGQRILIVDDDPAMGRALQRHLKKEGYGVELFRRPELALEVIRGAPHDYDLVITDFSMPTMTGVDVASRVLQLRPDLPIILLSGALGLEDDVRAKLTAFQAILAKPVVPAELSEIVSRVLGAPAGRRQP